MKRSKLIIITMVLLLIWPVWWMGHRAASLNGANPSTLGQQPDTLRRAASSTMQKSTPTFTGEEEANSPEKKQRQYLEKARSIGQNTNRPAKFYGQVLDQDNQPVPEVAVECGLSRFGETVLPGLVPQYEQFERSTDTAGRFAFEGQNGLALDVRLMPKQGYDFKPAKLQVMLRDQGVDEPAPTLSTPDKPYIFHAFRKSPAEALLKGEIAFYDCKPDGRSYLVQLKSNRVIEGSAGGDFTVSVQRPQGWADQTDYDWAVQIDGVDMEIMETDDTFMYRAPESGYVSSWRFSRSAGEQNYIREVAPKFYLKNRNEAGYGRMELRIKSNSRDRSAILIYYWLNPSGSRNLEYDSQQSVGKAPVVAKPVIK